MSQKDPPPRNYFPLAVDQVLPNGFEQPHDLLHGALLTGSLGFEIDVLSPVHVGAGAYGLVDGRVVKAPVVRGGVPVVPGTSIKGACRQIHEVLTQSASPFDRDLPHGEKRRSESTALFGRLGFQGRVSFDDAVPVGPCDLVEVSLSVGYPPQAEVGRRFYGPMPEGARQPPRIPALAIPRGATLATVLRFRNVRPEELGTVLFSLGVDRFTPKLGGAKYDPLGWVRFRPVRYRLRGGLSYRPTSWIDSPDQVAAFCAEKTRQVASRLSQAGRSALQVLEERMQAPSSETGGAS
jgi:CRISPR/Cas system CMR subunit Cmr6 (Cas7 group RAMP superfamily)